MAVFRGDTLTFRNATFMCAWLENPATSAISTRGMSVYLINLHASSTRVSKAARRLFFVLMIDGN